jgi:alkanesulfonate monooxygenase SsuD/methylene tetrahydromethanopterin reductase-like flavin-dependent oxidoreductase (luciferase family)
VPFPSTGERFERLEEQLAIITGMWRTPVGERFDFAGRHYSVVDSPALPKPAQSELPIIVGGNGPSRTPRLAATYAAEFNHGFPPLDGFVAQTARVRAACAAIGRDPATLVLSFAHPVCCGRDEAEVARRAKRIGRSPEDLRQNAVAGTVDEVVARLRQWAEAGASRAYLQVLDIKDLEHIQLIAEAVVPAV